MTIIIGMICENGIVVASDSQTTYGTAKRIDTEKMHSIDFFDGEEVLVAQSGDAILTSRLIEIMREKADELTLSDWRAPAYCAEMAIRELKGEMLAALQGEDRPLKEREDLFLGHDASLMIAYYYEKKPHIFQIDFTMGVAIEQKKYSCMGCGATVAEFIIGWFDCAGLSLLRTLITSVYIIEEVKKVDAFCGGPTQLAAIVHGGEIAEDLSGDVVQFFTRPAIDLMVEKLNVLDKDAKAHWQTNMHTTIIKASEEFKSLNAITKTP